MPNALGYAATAATSPLAPLKFERRDPTPRDVQIQILFCGVCHSDLHTVRNEWQNAVYPVIPGHEIIGKVTKVGSQVRKFKAGDTVDAWSIHAATAPIAATGWRTTATTWFSPTTAPTSTCQAR